MGSWRLWNCLDGDCHNTQRVSFCWLCQNRVPCRYGDIKPPSQAVDPRKARFVFCTVLIDGFPPVMWTEFKIAAFCSNERVGLHTSEPLPPPSVDKREAHNWSIIYLPRTVNHASQICDEFFWHSEKSNSLVSFSASFYFFSRRVFSEYTPHQLSFWAFPTEIENATHPISSKSSRNIWRKKLKNYGTLPSPQTRMLAGVEAVHAPEVTWSMHDWAFDWQVGRGGGYGGEGAVESMTTTTARTDSGRPLRLQLAAQNKRN